MIGGEDNSPSKAGARIDLRKSLRICEFSYERWRRMKKLPRNFFTPHTRRVGMIRTFARAFAIHIEEIIRSGAMARATAYVAHACSQM